MRSVGCSSSPVALLSPSAERHSPPGPPASLVPAAAEPEVAGGEQSHNGNNGFMENITFL